MSQAKALWWVWCTEYPEDGASIHEGASEHEARADFLTDTRNHDWPPEVTVERVTVEEVRELFGVSDALREEAEQVVAYLRGKTACENIANMRGATGYERWDCIRQEAPSDERCERCTNLAGLDAAISKAKGEA